MSVHFSKVRGWVGAGVADAAGRLVILSGATAILAHLLDPGDFGVSALVLSVVSIFAVFVGTPYEEALAQRRVLRRIHLASALAASLGSALVFVAVSVGAGWLMDRAYGHQHFAVILPVASCMLFAQGPLTVAVAVARRRRAFYAINISGLVGHGVGAAFAIALGLAGAGIWALIGLRIGIVVVNALVLMAMMRLAVMPRWSWQTVSELNRYAKYILLTRLVENMTLLVYNMAVGSFFGLTVLGYANMAMRLIEPVRGAIVAITHNLSFSYFVTLTRDGSRIAEETRRISDESTVLIAPIFMGLAAISPLAVPIIAGPGWGATVPIAVMLALGGMVALPSQVVISTLSAIGRPEQSVLANVFGLGAMLLVLAVTIGMDPLYVGAARAVGDLVQTMVTIVFSGGLILLPRRILLRRLSQSWLMAGAMAVLVAALGIRLALLMPALVALPLAVASGIIIYGLLLYLFARPSFDRLQPLLPRRSAPIAVQTAAE